MAVTKGDLMRNNRPALSLLLISQALFLLSSLIEPPSGLLMVALRVIVPLLVILYLGPALAGLVSPGRR